MVVGGLLGKSGLTFDITHSGLCSNKNKSGKQRKLVFLSERKKSWHDLVLRDKSRLTDQKFH